MPAIMHQDGVIGKAKDIPMPTQAVTLQLLGHVSLRLQLIAQATHQSFDDVVSVAGCPFTLGAASRSTDRGPTP